jgi:hypothetical protein
MTQFRRVTDHFEVSPQITPDEARRPRRRRRLII